MNSDPDSLTYKDAGVDIDVADALVDDIVEMSERTQSPQVISGIGGFAGLFAPDLTGYSMPVLVASTDGVGTKLNLAIEGQRLTGLGQDLVAMCVNDLVCCGAKPLFFLDYFATGKLDAAQLKTVIASITRALQNVNCALLGGETAEMPGLYQSGDFDLAGFAVGIVDKAKMLDGKKTVRAGDVLIGLASAGVHSNGFSLVRKILSVKKIDVQLPTAFAPQGLLHALLLPTKLYVNSTLSLLEKIPARAFAHITGGGLVENLPRVYANHLQAIISKDQCHTPELFRYLQTQGRINEDEMWRVFNMGIGFVVIVPKEEAETTLAHFANCGETAYRLGSMQDKPNAQALDVVLT